MTLWNLTARSEVTLRKVAETLGMDRPSRILVVDDEENIRELLAMGLRYEGPEGVARRSPVWHTQERVSFRLTPRRAEMRKG